MKVEDIRKSLLNPRRLSLPLKPKVLDIVIFPYTDWVGEDALEVWVVIAENRRRNPQVSKNLIIIERTISDTLLEWGVDLFPYCRIVSPQELPTLAGARLQMDSSGAFRLLGQILAPEVTSQCRLLRKRIRVFDVSTGQSVVLKH